jgi:hypothetical protein
MEGGYLLLRMPKHVISVRQKSAQPQFYTPRVVAKATRLRHSAFHQAIIVTVRSRAA